MSKQYRTQGLQLIAGGLLLVTASSLFLFANATITVNILQMVFLVLCMILDAVGFFMLLGGAVLTVTADRSSHKPPKPFWSSFPTP